MPPFDNVKVRQAVNMAINKDRIVKLINGRTAPANQALPPSMPGYNKDQKGYAYDVEAAKKLMTDAGQGAGFATELYVMNVDPNPRIAQAIQQDLAAIGIKAEIKSLAQAEVIAAAGAGKTPMVWSGGMAWIADFPIRLPSTMASSVAAAPPRAAGTGRNIATRRSTSVPPPPIRWARPSRPPSG